jgi:tRNA 2-thiocytidine biosynthesis protein TtcA
MGKAIADFSLISDGDRVMVAVSGGKDSTILLLLLDELRRRSPAAFSLHPVLLDQVQPGFSADSYAAWLAARGLELAVIRQDTYAVVTETVKPGKAYCGLCSRLRRGILYDHAHAKGFTKIALGHHRDDLNETVLLNLFYNGRFASMPPKLRADDGRNVVIRPLAYVAEAELAAYAEELQIPVIPCNLCGSQPMLRRRRVKQLIRDLEAGEAPDIAASLLRAQRNVRPSQLLDSHIWDFDAFERVALPDDDDAP